MRAIGTILLMILTLLTAAWADARGETAPPALPARFPVVAGDNLNGKTFRLPGDLEGEMNVVVVAWEREHQSTVDTWLPTLAALAKTHPTLRYYEVPVIGVLPKIAQSFIDNGMRSGIPDIRTRAITITLYTDRAAFRKSLRLPSEKTIYVLLVDKMGAIHWRGEGAFTAAQGAALIAIAAKKAR